MLNITGILCLCYSDKSAILIIITQPCLSNVLILIQSQVTLNRNPTLFNPSYPDNFFQSVEQNIQEICLVIGWGWYNGRTFTILQRCSCLNKESYCYLTLSHQTSAVILSVRHSSTDDTAASAQSCESHILACVSLIEHFFIKLDDGMTSKNSL